MQRSLLIGSIVLAIASVCPAQTAKLTFYTDKQDLKSTVKELAPTGTMPFGGWLYDGQDRLAAFRIGRFVTFDLPSGSHSLSTCFGSHKPAPSEAYPLNAEAGQHYCFRLTQKYIEWYPVGFATFHDPKIEQVACDRAFKEAGNTKPLERKHIDKTAQSKLDPIQEFPKE